jgi:two-component system chemotaxis response regulator CheB
MAGRDIIVIGKSLGGVKALTELVHGLPPGLPAALFVVCHSRPTPAAGCRKSSAGTAPAGRPRPGPRAGAARPHLRRPPDQHMLLAPGTVK